MRKEAEGGESKREVKRDWAIASIQGILENDFYIGTMRSSKYTRKKINGKDIKRDESVVPARAIEAESSMASDFIDFMEEMV